MHDSQDATTLFRIFWDKRGKRELELILERHLPWIQSYVHRKLGAFPRNKADTGDIVQNALVEFIRNGPRFRLSNERQLRALLCRIVENVLCNMYDWFTAHRRAMARERPLPPDVLLNLDPPASQVDSPSQIARNHEREAWIRMSLELLDPEERRVILYRTWENHSFSEIGKRLGVSKGTARTRFLKSLNKLQETAQTMMKGGLAAVLDEDLFERDEP
jgi:RNA polymerase sigma factor (sigma-70 family)